MGETYWGFSIQTDPKTLQCAVVNTLEHPKNINSLTRYCTDAPDLYEMCSEAERQRFERTLETLTVLGIDYERRSRLVRGLDYYNDLVFEFVVEPNSPVSNLGATQVQIVCFCVHGEND